MDAASGLVRCLVPALALLALAAGAAFLLWALRGPPMKPWQTMAFAEPDAAAIDKMDWATWQAGEQALFGAAEQQMGAALSKDDQVAWNRYWPGAPMHPAALARDWNRSFVLRPAGPPLGAVVLIHGLTDSPYSLRHFALFYQQRGWAVVGVRLPGHGTTPASLARTSRRQWQAATRLAVREAQQLAPGKPLTLIGYSTGATLALLHGLDSLANPALGRPDALILLSPMIRLAPAPALQQLARLPALLPPSWAPAWLERSVEYNPFKYISFPFHAGVEAWALTRELADKRMAAEQSGRWAAMPPVLAFQSVADATVSAPAVVHALFDHLPQNGSELVLADVNRAAYVGPLLGGRAAHVLARLLPTSPRRYRIRILASDRDGTGTLRTIEPGTLVETKATLPLSYPRAFYSLSHVALPFPLGDGLYGARPDPADQQGISLGAISIRGETELLHVPTRALSRVTSNPFLPWFLSETGQVAERLEKAAGPSVSLPATPPPAAPPAG